MNTYPSLPLSFSLALFFFRSRSPYLCQSISLTGVNALSLCLVLVARVLSFSRALSLSLTRTPSLSPLSHTLFCRAVSLSRCLAASLALSLSLARAVFLLHRLFNLHNIEVPFL